MKKMKNKGFTLIEILAVVMIIGVLGIIGVSAISSYIEESRKSTFIATAKVYIDAARDLKAGDKLIQEPKDTEAVLIPLDILELEENHDFSTPYGEIDKNKSYIIITNENNKLKYYVTILDESGHALVMIEEGELSKDNIQVSQLNNIDIKTHQMVKDRAVKEAISIGGILYQVSTRDYDEKKEGTEEYITTTVLLDCNPLDSFRVEVEEGWINRDKKIAIYTISNKENYKYYLSTRSIKPLKSDSLWQENNNYERDLGTYYAFVQSEAGEISEPVKVIVDKIDRVAPTCELEVQSGTKSSYGIYNTNATIGFKTATDGIETPTTSGVKNYGIGSATGNKTHVDSITGEITDTYTGHIVDNAGNTNQCEITVKSDGVAPTVTYNLAAGSYSVTKTITITPQDVGHGWDYYDVKVTKNGTVITNETNLKGSTYQVTISDNAKYVISTKVVDKANNKITQTPLDGNGYYYREYIIDKVTPTVTFTANKKTSGTAINTDTWSTEGLNFVLTEGTVGYSDATIKYCKDTTNTCTPSTVAASGSTITSYNTTTGTYYIRYTIISGAGLSSPVASFKAKVDTTTPTVTLTAKKKTAGTTVNTDTWSNQELNFVLTKGSVGPSGATIYYCKDTANTCNPTTVATSGSTITSYNTTTGTYYIRYKITSVAGLSSPVANFKAKVDTSVPTIANVTGNPTSWTNQNVTLTVNATDSGSGLNASAYSFDNGATWQAGNTKTYSSNQTVTIKVRDAVGNISSATSVVINKIDKSSPTCTNSGDSTSWTTSNRTINYGCSDTGGSGCNSSYSGGSTTFSTSTKTSTIASYTIKDNAGNTVTCPSRTANVYVDKNSPTCTNSGDSTSWTNGSRTINYGCSDTGGSGCNSSYSGGSTTFSSSTKTSTISSYTIKDNAGNTVTCSSRTANVYVDKNSPTCSFSYSTTSWTNQLVGVTFTTRDTGGSSIAYYTYTMNGSTTRAEVWHNEYSSQNVWSNTSSPVVFRVYDAAGNSGSCNLSISNVDQENPSCTISLSTESWTNGNVTATITGSDNASGVASYTFDPASGYTTSKTKTFSEEAANTNGRIITAFVKDNAGNTSAMCSKMYKIDKTKPTISCTKSNTGTTSGVTITCTCSDGLSGVKTCAGQSGSSATITGVKSDQTYYAVDNAGNTSTGESITVTSQRQKRTASCSTCSRCSSASCETYTYTCTCGKPSGASCTSTTKSGTGGCSSVCGFVGSCGYSQTGSSCKTRARSCSKCGCSTWGSWSGWSNVSSCSASTGNSTKTGCQTVYN